MRRSSVIIAILGMLAATAAGAQTLRLRQVGTADTRVEAAVGEVVEIEIVADVQEVAAVGIAVFLSIEGDGLTVADKGGPDQGGTQPFVPGSLFHAPAATNTLLSETGDPVAATIPGLQLDYAVLLPEDATPETEPGVVATVQLMAVSPATVHVVVDDNPVRETRLVGADRVTERRFTAIQGMEITVVERGTDVDAATWGTLKRQGG